MPLDNEPEIKDLSTLNRQIVKSIDRHVDTPLKLMETLHTIKYLFQKEERARAIQETIQLFREEFKCRSSWSILNKLDNDQIIGLIERIRTSITTSLNASTEKQKTEGINHIKEEYIYIPTPEHNQKIIEAYFDKLDEDGFFNLHVLDEEIKKEVKKGRAIYVPLDLNLRKKNCF